MTSSADTNPAYWREYSNLQHVKHELIRHYLNGWFPKLGFWAGSAVYLDTHAGRGMHSDGHLGSPLVALDTFLNHTARERLLKRSEFRFLFIERDADNLKSLQNELESRPRIENLVVETHCADAFTVLRDILDGKSKFAAAFAFIDPYGFKVPSSILRDLMRAGRVELFINVIWRELDMEISQAKDGNKPGMTETLEIVFDGDAWKGVDADDLDERADQAVRILASKIGARWHTYVRMLGGNGRTRYVLLHLTNHPDGRDLMKDCIWKVAPDGGFYARKSVDPGQLVLITPEPNLAPLRDWVIATLKEGPRRWKGLQALLREELWRETHLNRTVIALKKEGVIESRDPDQQFSAKANPILLLADEH